MPAEKVTGTVASPGNLCWAINSLAFREHLTGVRKKETILPTCLDQECLPRFLNHLYVQFQAKMSFYCFCYKVKI